MPFDPERYASGLKRQNKKEAERIAALAEEARNKAHELSTAIAQADPEVRAVYLFGSLAGEGPRHLNFDIDLAIDGGDVFAAEQATEDSDFSVDVVALDRLPPDTAARIRRSGLLLFERA
ncbi:MAG: nucleotidyltransferase domain-containing protein [Spirochaetales bacterium]